MATERNGMTATPPRWAEALLAVVVERDDVDSVSGDLLEQYRDSVHPLRGRRRADWWYVTQVTGFVWRNAWVWALFFGGAFLVRTALDWLMPPLAFQTRAVISTGLAAGILLSAGCWAAWRSGSVIAGTVAGMATAVLGAFVSVAGAAALLALWHDAATMVAVQSSGGVTEVLVLPFMMVLPAAVIGTVGGLAGAAMKRMTTA
jgi:hypothetical protein